MGFGRSSRGIQDICVDLCAVVHANFHVAASVHPEKRTSSLYQDFEEHYEAILSAKTIELAVNLRALFDRCALLSNPNPLSEALYKLEHFVFEEGSGPTTIREATNKIIHAGHFGYQFAWFESVGPDQRAFRSRVEESTVELTGHQFGKRWRCSLDILEFIEVSHSVSSELRQKYAC